MALTYRGVKGSPLTIEEIDSNFAYFTGSHSVTGSLTVSGSLIVSGSLVSTEAIQISGTLNPVDSQGSSLGSPEYYWGELYIGLDSVNFMGQPGSLVASIKTWGEGATYPEPASGMVYIAPWYTSGSSVVQKPLRGSFGVGTGSIALGTGSVTLGRFLSALGNHQTVVGAFNRSSSADSSFIIGNGTSTLNRSNLLFASGSQIQVTGSIVTNGVYMTPQTINNSTTIPNNTNALLIGPSVSLPANTSTSVGQDSVLTILGDIEYPNDIDVNNVTANNITLNLSTLIQATDDTEAANAGVVVGGLYRNGSFIQIRLS